MHSCPRGMERRGWGGSTNVFFSERSTPCSSPCHSAIPTVLVANDSRPFHAMHQSHVALSEQLIAGRPPTSSSYRREGALSSCALAVNVSAPSAAHPLGPHRLSCHFCLWLPNTICKLPFDPHSSAKAQRGEQSYQHRFAGQGANQAPGLTS